jgi:zinc protease
MTRWPTAALLFIVALSTTLARSQDPSTPLGRDPQVAVGRLDNGLTYYIRVNQKPEKRAELRLVVNAGSVLESEAQRGLAHFVEHMGFNGTRNFQKQELVNFLESIGMRFGPEINAYTSTDETVYMLTIPTDTAAIVERAFDILEDWAQHMSFDSVEIEKERGVVIEEWRRGRGAEARMRDKQVPIILKGSRYAERLPIGRKEILESFPQDTLRAFYTTWYRPDLMAVVAVGDLDSSTIESLIKKHFSAIPSRRPELKRPEYPVPDHQEPLFAIATDPEATSSRVAIYFKHAVQPEQTVGDYRRLLVERLYNGMLNNRLNELTKQTDPPFLAGYSAQGRFVRTKEVYVLGAVVKNNGIERGLKALLAESARIRQHGFTETELEREKKSMLRGIGRAYQERDKTESARFAGEYVENFLTGEPFPGIQAEYDMHRALLPSIALEDVDSLARKLITEENRVIAVNAPDKPDVRVPSAEELGTLIAATTGLKMPPYVDKASAQPLLPHPPTPSPIVEERKLEEIGVTEWKLANGVRVVLKPTDFKNDEVLCTGYSPGGTSRVKDEDYTPAVTACGVVQEGGVGTFDEITLQKLLADKIVQVSPFISDLSEGISASCSPSDLETMFQLIYLYCTAPRADSVAFESYKTRLKGFIQNRSASPGAAMADTVMVTMAQHHYRKRPFSDAILDEMDLAKSLRVYHDRFADGGDFTFIIVGAFQPSLLAPLVERYLGGLPALARGESWKDVGIRYPSGVIEKEVRKGLEPKSSVRMTFTGPFTWSPDERYDLNSVIALLRITLREALREDKGGTYGVDVSGTPHHFPRSEFQTTISFGCSPDNVEDLTRTALAVVDSLKRFGPTTDDLNKVKEMQIRDRETNLKENGFWLNTLRFYSENGEDPLQVLKFDKQVEGLNGEAIQRAARMYFDEANYARFVLYPERM